MEEATSDKQRSTSGSKRNRPKTQGWIRMHSDETMKSTPVSEELDDEPKSLDGKIRKESERASKDPGNSKSD
jgi:hypothetical protein